MAASPPKKASVGFVLGKSGAYIVLIVGLVATLLPFFILLSLLKMKLSFARPRRISFPRADLQALHHHLNRRKNSAGAKSIQ